MFMTSSDRYFREQLKWAGRGYLMGWWLSLLMPGWWFVFVCLCVEMIIKVFDIYSVVIYGTMSCRPGLLGIDYVLATHQILQGPCHLLFLLIFILQERKNENVFQNVFIFK